jgi:hypothetical protein
LQNDTLLKMSMISERYQKGIGILAAVVFLALAVATALTKRPWFDEAYWVAPAADLVKRGSMGQPVAEPLGFQASPGISQLRVNTSVYYAPPLSFLVEAVWYKIVGFGIFRMRAFEILWGLVALSGWFVIVTRLTGSHATALVAMVLIGCDHFFVNSAADGRPDMMSLALAALAVASYLYLRTNNLDRAILVSQALLAASVFTHPIGGIAGVAIALIADKFDVKRLQWRHVLLAAAPYVILGALWGIYISRDPAAFRAQMAGNNVGRFSSLNQPFHALGLEISTRFLERAYFPSYGQGLRGLTVVIPIIFAVSVAVVLLRRSNGQLGQAGRFLGVFAVCYFLLFAIFDGAKPAFYLVHFTPLLVSCAAVWLIGDWQAGGWRRLVASAAIAVLLVLQVFWTVYGIRRNAYRNVYQPVVAYLRENMKTGDSVYAASEFAFGLGFYDQLRDDSTLGYFTGRPATYIVVDEAGYNEAFKGFAARNPELDRYVRTTLTNDYERVFSASVYQVYRRR